MQSENSIDFHESEVIPEEDESWDVDDVFGSIPEVRHEFEGSCC